MSEFNNALNPDNVNRERTTHITMHVKTFGTDEQRRESIRNLEKELHLRGFNFTLLVINSD